MEEFNIPVFTGFCYTTVANMLSSHSAEYLRSPASSSPRRQALSVRWLGRLEFIEANNLLLYISGSLDGCRNPNQLTPRSSNSACGPLQHISLALYPISRTGVWIDGLTCAKFALDFYSARDNDHNLAPPIWNLAYSSNAIFTRPPTILPQNRAAWTLRQPDYNVENLRSRMAFHKILLRLSYIFIVFLVVAICFSRTRAVSVVGTSSVADIETTCANRLRGRV